MFNFAHQIWNDKRLMSRISLTISIFLDFGFVVFKTGNGIYHHRAWPIAIGVYYFVLFIIRLVLFRGLRKETKLPEERRTARGIGIALLILNLILAGMMIQMISSKAITKYGAPVAVIDAVYLIYRIILAIANAIRYKKSESPLLTTTKYINLVAAMVAVMMVQTTILESLGETDLDLMRVLNAITALGVAGTIIGLSVGLINRGKITQVAKTARTIETTKPN